MATYWVQAHYATSRPPGDHEWWIVRVFADTDAEAHVKAAQAVASTSRAVMPTRTTILEMEI